MGDIKNNQLVRPDDFPELSKMHKEIQIQELKDRVKGLKLNIEELDTQKKRLELQVMTAEKEIEVKNNAIDVKKS